jgi:hypothetical protein
MSNTDLKCALYGNFGPLEALDRAGYVDKSVQGDYDGVWVTKQGPDRQWSPATIAYETIIDLPHAAKIAPKVWINPWAHDNVDRLFKWDHVIAEPSSRTGIRVETR